MSARCFSAHGPSWSYDCRDRYTFPCTQHFRYWAMKEWSEACAFDPPEVRSYYWPQCEVTR